MAPTGSSNQATGSQKGLSIRNGRDTHTPRQSFNHAVPVTRRASQPSLALVVSHPSLVLSTCVLSPGSASSSIHRNSSYLPFSPLPLSLFPRLHESPCSSHWSWSCLTTVAYRPSRASGLLLASPSSELFSQTLPPPFQPVSRTDRTQSSFPPITSAIPPPSKMTRSSSERRLNLKPLESLDEAALNSRLQVRLDSSVHCEFDRALPTVHL